MADLRHWSGRSSRRRQGQRRRHWHRTDEYRTAKRELRRVVRQVKRAFWDRQVANAHNDSDLYRVTRWGKDRYRYQPPPIVHEGRSYESDAQRAALLATTVVDVTGHGTEDIPEDDAWAIPDDLARDLSPEWDPVVTEQEAITACIGTKPTAAGLDGLGVALIKAAWRTIKEPV